MLPDSANAYPSGNTASLWMGTSEVPDYPPLDRSLTADVCVVGAGIAGMSTAYMLMKAGKSVVVVDDGPVGGGESGRTTAHLANAIDDGIYEIAKVHGEESARLAVESHTVAIDRIEEIVRLEGIDCDFSRLDGYLFLGPGESREVLDQELAAAHKAGLVQATQVNRAPIADFDTGPALKFPRQGQFHVLRYLRGIAAAFVRGGGRICGRTHVASIEGGSPCTVKTDSKKKITADAVVVCTNSSISDYVRTHTEQAPYRTFAIAAVIPRGSVTRALYWDTSDPYHYVRLQPLDDPSQGVLETGMLYDALIVGGEDVKTGHADDAEERWIRLERWMRERFPAAREVVYQWSGQVLEPTDGLAFIGRNPDGAENVFMVSGDSGMGMTHGTMAGIMITDLIMGRDNPWVKLYDPRRVSLRPGPVEEFAKHNLDVAVRFVKDHLTPGQVSSEDDIPRGEGRLLRHGMHKVAAYRDATGTLHLHSAACTHLQCVVAWNSAEGSWDCPCHGSRFDPYGKVLNGPALADLAEVGE